MKVIHVRNVHAALPEGIRALEAEGVHRESRNGPVLMFDQPVTTVYEKPAERVLFWAERDANPFFHLVESLWMLNGSNDVETLAGFVPRMRDFSDDGETFHGAYGHRWRRHFEMDQLPHIIQALRRDETDRRQVLSMWDARVDLARRGKDLPCNLQAVFQITSRGYLDMTVTNRSNDMIWGAYGANAVHFSYLHEFVSLAVGVPQGRYRQVSANFHAYLNTLDPIRNLAAMAENPYDPHRDALNPYAAGSVSPYPLMVSSDWESWLWQLNMLIEEGPCIGIRDPFFRRVAIPMLLAHAEYKNSRGPARYEKALKVLEGCEATDWKRAAKQWLYRRKERAQIRRARAEDDGPSHDE